MNGLTLPGCKKALYCPQGFKTWKNACQQKKNKKVTLLTGIVLLIDRKCLLLCSLSGLFHDLLTGEKYFFHKDITTALSPPIKEEKKPLTKKSN